MASVNSWRVTLTLGSLLALYTLGAFAQTSVERGRDAIVERSWMEDADGALTVDEAKEGNWTAFTDLFSAGITRSTYWIRLRVDPDRADAPRFAADTRLVLNLLPLHLDEIAVFRSDQPERPPVLLGDRHLAGASRMSYPYTVVLDGATAPLELFLRIRTEGNLAAYPQVMRWDESRDYGDRVRNFLLLYVFGCLAATAWAIYLWFATRLRLVLLFINQQMIAVVCAFFLNGLYQLCDIEWLQKTGDGLTAVIIPILAYSILAFHRQVLGDLGARPGDKRFMAWLHQGYLAAVLLCALQWTSAGLTVNHVLTVVSALVFPVVAWRIRTNAREVDPAQRWVKPYVRITYLLLGASVIPQFARVFNLYAPGFWSLWGYFGVQGFGAILIGGYMVIRHHQTTRAAAAEALIFSLEKARSAAQSELIAMLAHELKTPLSVVSLALGTFRDGGTMLERAQRSVLNMRTVIDHCEKTVILNDAHLTENVIGDAKSADVGRLISEVVEVFVDKHRIVVRTSDHLTPAIVDPGIFGIIVNNMLSNALKYSPAHSTVVVTVGESIQADAPGIALSVSNQVGPAGKPDPERVFQKYHRTSGARHISGSGLGLYLSNRLAQRFGGRMRLLRCEPDVVFEAWFPCYPDLAGVKGDMPN